MAEQLVPGRTGWWAIRLSCFWVLAHLVAFEEISSFHSTHLFWLFICFSQTGGGWLLCILTAHSQSISSWLISLEKHTGLPPAISTSVHTLTAPPEIAEWGQVEALHASPSSLQEEIGGWFGLPHQRERLSLSSFLPLGIVVFLWPGTLQTVVVYDIIIWRHFWRLKWMFYGSSSWEFSVRMCERKQASRCLDILTLLCQDLKEAEIWGA